MDLRAVQGRAQYTSTAHARLADRLGIRLLVGRPSRCRDNALTESFFATIEGELLDECRWSSWVAACSALFELIEGWYNLRRLHSSLGSVSPAA
jgi:transposase InsO family protein